MSDRYTERYTYDSVQVAGLAFIVVHKEYTYIPYSH